MFEQLTDGKNHPNGWPCALHVCSQYESRRIGTAGGTTHLISIRGTANKLLTMSGIAPENHLVLVIDDSLDPTDPDGPKPAHVDEIRAFLDRLPAEARLLVHCLQGIHRGPGTALGILGRYLPAESAGSALHDMHPTANPNRLIVSQWDEALGLKSALLRVANRFPCRSWKKKVA